MRTDKGLTMKWPHLLGEYPALYSPVLFSRGQRILRFQSGDSADALIQRQDLLSGFACRYKQAAA